MVGFWKKNIKQALKKSEGVRKPCPVTNQPLRVHSGALYKLSLGALLALLQLSLRDLVAA
jgi:hypothetical protein